jgi:hypothetical protein
MPMMLPTSVAYGHARRRVPLDVLATLTLIVLWALYFWRIFTPNGQDALSLTEGDFSGQFVAFFGYQVERLHDGEIPLWNPYNYAGHPFLADTQSAVFYPPRLLMVMLVGDKPSPGDLYSALQTEMALHVLLGTLFLYAFIRRLTVPPENEPIYPSIFAGLVAALTYGYSGYLSGYPQLQLAVMEAGIWLPLVLFCLFQATRSAQPGWLWMVVAGAAMSFSLLAGHPQTSLFILYLALAFLAYRLWPIILKSWSKFVWYFVGTAAVFGLIAGGLAAIQLLPGLEYLQHTTRQSMGFDAKGNGFPYQDLIQILFPGFMTLWSPLYMGIAGVVLAILALIRRVPHCPFFGIAALIGLGLSFGTGTMLYDLIYLLAPGASWFRGQERAAFVFAYSISVLVGLGTAEVLRLRPAGINVEHLRRALLGLLAVCGIMTIVLFVLWLTPDRATYESALRSMAFATLLSALTAAILPWLVSQPTVRLPRLALVALIVFDLFSITMGTPNFDTIPAKDRLSEPAIVRQLREDLLPIGSRVDGQRGLRANYGTLYDVPDIHGISPLELDSIHAFREDLPIERVWDLLAVSYVLTDWNELPVPSEIIISAEDPFGVYNVHRLVNPRSFAHLTYGATIVGSNEEAYGLLREPAYDTRQFVILASNPGIDLPGAVPAEPSSVELKVFEAERIVIEVQTPTPAVLTLALPHYPGWQVTRSGTNTDLLRAYGGLSAVTLPEAGQYTIQLTYAPQIYQMGRWISIITLGLVVAIIAVSTSFAQPLQRRWRHTPA